MPLELHAVSAVLSTIQGRPHVRVKPIEGDLPGDFDRWFDGGAVKHVTGWDEYQFADGTLAVLSGGLLFNLDIRFPSATCVNVREQPSGSLPFTLDALYRRLAADRPFS